jgi:drug/metabolite transporter (DMT)-like permease
VPLESALAVLASALLHAAWNAMLKRAPDTEAAAALVILGASGLSGALALTFGPAAVPGPAVPWIVAAGVIEAVYFVTLAAALARLSLQSAYGVSRGLGVLLVWPMSIAIFAEPATARSLGGAALLSIGLFVQMRTIPRSSGLWLAIACAGAIACYPLAYKRAIALDVSPYSLFALSLAMALPVQLAALGKARVPRLRAALRPIILVSAACCAASFLIFLHALKSSGPAHVSALRNTSVLFAAMFGWARGETLDGRALGSALLITVGAVLVAL